MAIECVQCGDTGRIHADVPGRAGPLLVSFCTCPMGDKVTVEALKASMPVFVGEFGLHNEEWVEEGPHDPNWLTQEGWAERDARREVSKWTPRQVEEAIKAQLAERAKNHGWISVKKQRPDHPGREVLATDGPHCFVAVFDHSWWCQQSGKRLDDITHWRELPPVPEDEPETATIPLECGTCNRTFQCSCHPDDVQVAGHYRLCECFQHIQHCSGSPFSEKP